MSNNHSKPAVQARAWQRMLSGRRLDLLDPSPLDVEISDIAHGLARVARWNGQTKGPNAFSVAQHSVLVWQISLRLKPQLSANWQLMALLHDGPEYVVGDMISPFKAVIGGDYKLLEERLLSAIHLRYSLPATTPQKLKTFIKRADKIAAYFEATHLAGFTTAEALKYFGKPGEMNPEGLTINPLTTHGAQKQFMQVFQSLENLRQENNQ
ncbi:MAG: HD family hydrolase [Rhizobiaceae bacterium]|nr:HD family hydrolase [Rhizobiaceae bacterium]